MGEAPKRGAASLISEETARELKRAAEELAEAPHLRESAVPLDLEAPPVFPSAMAAEPDAISSGPITHRPEPLNDDWSSDDWEEPVDDQPPGWVAKEEPVAEGWVAPPVVVPEDDPDAPRLPLSMEEPPAVSRISMDQLMPDPKAFEALRKLAGPAGNPDKARAALEGAFTGGSYDPRALPDPRTMIVGIARVLAAHGLPVDEMVEAIMAGLTD